MRREYVQGVVALDKSLHILIEYPLGKLAVLAYGTHIRKVSNLDDDLVEQLFFGDCVLHLRLHHASMLKTFSLAQMSPYTTSKNSRRYHRPHPPFFRMAIMYLWGQYSNLLSILPIDRLIRPSSQIETRDLLTYIPNRKRRICPEIKSPLNR